MTDTRLLLATTNAGKIHEIREGLEGLSFKIVSLEEAALGGHCKETGKTLLENARIKSLYYSRRWPDLILGEDSGLEIDALRGAPGVRSARFSHPKPTDDKNNSKVLRLLQGIPERNRRARFVCTLVLSKGGQIIKEIRGEVLGRIASEPKGHKGFGYDPLFYYPPLRKTFAELSAEKKNAVSHRGRAIGELKEFLESFLEKPSALRASPSPKK